MYSLRAKYILIGIVFTSSTLLPAIFQLMMSFTANLNNEMKKHKDRFVPYIFSAFSIFLGSQLIGKLPLPNVFRLFMLGLCTVLILLFIISLKWKISCHTAGLGALTGAFSAIIFKYGIDIIWLLILVILFSGAIATSRMYLKKHTPGQVYAGYFLSIFVMYFAISLF